LSSRAKFSNLSCVIASEAWQSHSIKIKANSML
jgi:hypothetical protein